MELATHGNTPSDKLCREGVQHFREQRVQEAEAKFKESLAIDKNHLGSLNALALLRCEQEDHVSTKELYTRALAAFPDHPETLFNFAAYNQLRLGDTTLCEKLYLRALDVEPKQVNCLFNLAALYNSKQEFVKCFDTYKKILRIEPRHVDSMCNCGQLLQATFNDAEMAEAMYKKALETNCWFALGRSFMMWICIYQYTST